MKKFILIPCLLFASMSFSQSVNVTKITQIELAKFIGSINSYEPFAGSQLYLSTFIISNGSGSANIPGTDATSFNIFLGVAHYDQQPDNKLFSIGPFSFPKIIENRDSGDSITVVIQHFEGEKKRKTEIVVTETNVKLIP
ncbi:MAG: hypothetical protein ACOYKR_12960 [Sphingobacterium thalpophilum]